MQVRFELTRNAELLEQYYRLRERCFREDLGLPDFDGSEDAWDRCSQILIAREGDRCIGGMRITGREPALGVLPIEEEGVDLSCLRRALPQDSPRYCQWGRLALLPEVRSTELLQDFIAEMIIHSRQLGYQYSVMVAGMNRSRLYRRLYRGLGLRYDIVPELRVPAEEGFEELPHLLSVAWLRHEEDQAAALASVKRWRAVA
ncbi:hypothetical protein [Motiliproteus sediminis]|uniref:hypothetical protein n=1 Tax=Motiliproteus sediminis TaxID=1468178 RepID=UPI001AEFAB48|nr:hypothetical protein [Motiliproteus sediminis]